MIHKALIVNDDATTLFIVNKLVNKAQFAEVTVTANNGEKALAYFEEIVLLGENHFSEVPAFIFLDLHMPVINGWKFLEIFSEKYASLFPWVKVIIFSSSIDEQELNDLRRYVMVSDFLSTPVNIEKIQRLKEKLLYAKRPDLFIPGSPMVLN